MGCSPSMLCLSHHSEFIVINENRKDVTKEQKKSEEEELENSNLSLDDSFSAASKSRSHPSSLTQKEHQKIIQEIREIKNCWKSQSTSDKSSINRREFRKEHGDKTKSEGHILFKSL